MPRYRLTLEYDGRGFVGWQRQDNGLGVQQAIEDAVRAFCGEVVTVLDDWKGRPISPTLPVIVAFGRYKAHFRADELSPVA